MVVVVSKSTPKRRPKAPPKVELMPCVRGKLKKDSKQKEAKQAPSTAPRKLKGRKGAPSRPSARSSSPPLHVARS